MFEPYVDEGGLGEMALKMPKATYPCYKYWGIHAYIPNLALESWAVDVPPWSVPLGGADDGNDAIRQCFVPTVKRFCQRFWNGCDKHTPYLPSHHAASTALVIPQAYIRCLRQGARCMPLDLDNFIHVLRLLTMVDATGYCNYLWNLDRPRARF